MSLACFLQLFLIISACSLASADMHHLLCPSGCNCYKDDVTDPGVMILHLVCRWNYLNTTALEDVAEYDPIYTIRIQCPHGSDFHADPPNWLFSRLKNLEHISIHRCKIRSLKKKLFSNLNRLNALVITNAGLSQLPNDLFDHIPRVKYLDLSDNNLRIDPYSVSRLSNLVYLVLSRNRIQFLSHGLTAMKDLKVLILEGNNLTSIDLRSIPQSVDTLRIRNNQISTLHYSPTQSKSLQFFDLAKNRLEFIAATGPVNVLPSGLISLHLSGNSIRTIQNGSFANMNSLKEIDLRNNSLEEFEESILDGVSRKLNFSLSGNPLKCACSLQWILNSTAQIILGDLNDITCTHIFNSSRRIPILHAKRKGDLLCKYEVSCPEDCECCLKPQCDCFSRCPVGCVCWHSAKPHSKRLGQNIVECRGLRIDRLEEIPPRATELRLIGSRWKEWSPSVIGPKLRLTTLNITNSGVTEISHDLLKNFPSIVHLDLSRNSIKHFPAEKLYGIVNLQTLFLNDNRIANFSMADLRRMEYFRELKLGGRSNLYFCDCDSPSAIQMWLHARGNKQKVLDYENLFCKMSEDRVVRMADVDPSSPNSICHYLVPEGHTTQLTFTERLILAETQTIPSPPRVVATWRPPARRTTVSKKPAADVERTILITITMFLTIILLVFLLIAIGFVAYCRYHFLDDKLQKKEQQRTPGTHKRQRTAL